MRSPVVELRRKGYVLIELPSSAIVYALISPYSGPPSLSAAVTESIVVPTGVVSGKLTRYGIFTNCGLNSFASSIVKLNVVLSNCEKSDEERAMTSNW